MDATSPEIRTIEVLLAVIAEQILHVLAYERRGVVAGRFEAVDHRWRTGEQVLDAVPGRRRCFFGSLAVSNIAPRADHLDWVTILVPDQALFVVYPAVGAVLLEKAVLDRVHPALEKLGNRLLDTGQVIGVDPVAPEGRIIE